LLFPPEIKRLRGFEINVKTECIFPSTTTYAFMVYAEKNLFLEIDKYGEKFSPINRIHARSETFLLHFAKSDKYQERIIVEKENKRKLKNRPRKRKNGTPFRHKPCKIIW
jgi:hypothetical protein